MAAEVNRLAGKEVNHTARATMEMFRSRDLFLIEWPS